MNEQRVLVPLLDKGVKWRKIALRPRSSGTEAQRVRIVITLLQGDPQSWAFNLESAYLALLSVDAFFKALGLLYVSQNFKPRNMEVDGSSSLMQRHLSSGMRQELILDDFEPHYWSSIVMLKHGRAGVPMEVMGLMLGEFVDDYTVRVIDVFAMPQSGTGVSVEAVDPVFQAKMLDMLKQTGRPEMVVGWYHSHPGFGCWLSGVDINTQQSFEALSERAVAVVVDPIQSVKGKVVIDAFRLINANMMVLGHEPRQTTSNLGHLNKPSIQALIHGLNRHYYSITINYRKNELEQKMLLNLHKKSWMEGLTLQDYSEHCKLNETVVKEMLELAKNYNKAVEEEDKMTPEQLAIKNVGKQDPKRHLEEHVDVLMTSNIVQCLAAMLDTVVFK
ncbi:26S proteasome non-ATPase regulatory subunit 14 [Mantella aurantiaca]